MIVSRKITIRPVKVKYLTSRNGLILSSVGFLSIIIKIGSEYRDGMRIYAFNTKLKLFLLSFPNTIRYKEYRHCIFQFFDGLMQNIHLMGPGKRVVSFFETGKNKCFV